ncbi:putative Vacuolar protein sorting-associated protein 5 (putative) [Pseudozyma hubeiensis]|nr:putative Vacuolar protein sorting-associated protein 5 (putative) [Pseudozyma hubeiensis]
MSSTDESPPPSSSSAAPSRFGTLSRPAPPPKPTHLSSAFTGTCNSIALRHYIQTHTTGGSFTTHSPSTATISRAHLGHGYDSSTVDHFVDAFDSASEDENDDLLRSPSTRPTIRGRTYTAPSVSRVFDASLDDAESVAGTSRLIRNENIAINGSGASKVGTLRNMFEAALPRTSTPIALSRQNTGLASQHTGTRTKPRISNQVRMLQAQITGDRFNGVAGAFHVADTRSSVVYKTPQKASNHRRDATDQSQEESIYRTATQDLLGDALKMDAEVIPPNVDSGTIRASSSSSIQSADGFTAEPTSVDSDTTISRSTSAKTGLTSSMFRGIAAQHGRDDSSATIRPSRSDHESGLASAVGSSNGIVTSPDATASTARRIPNRLVSGGQRGRLSSVFTADSQSPGQSSIADRSDVTDSPSGSIASRSASEAGTEAERSREPSMLIDDDDDVSFSRTSRHLRANDGSCFDLDSRSANTSPTKAATARRALLMAATAASVDSGAVGDGVRTVAGKRGEEAASELLRPPSRSVDPLVSSNDPAPALYEDAVKSVNQDNGLLHHAEPLLDSDAIESISQPSRPASSRLPAGIGKPARALYDFEGEAAFNELTIKAGQPFDILNEQLAGGWSLGIVWDDEGLPTRGLIPMGFYCLIQDFASPSKLGQDMERKDMRNTVEMDTSLGKINLPSPATTSLDRRKSKVKSQIREANSSLRQKGDSERSQIQKQGAESKHELATTPESTILSSSATSDDRADNSTDATSAANGFSTSEAHKAISVSAFLEIGNEAAQWEQVDKLDAVAQKDPVESSSAPIDMPQTLMPVISTTVIDGMPASSTEDNPIDWSAIQSSPSPLADTALLHGEAEEPIKSVADDAVPTAASTLPTASDWKGSVFGKKTFNRFASFVTSGAEDYVLSDSNPQADERSRTIARKVSGGEAVSTLPPALTGVKEEEDETASDGQARDNAHEERAEESEVELCAADPNHHFVIAGSAGPKWMSKSGPFLVQVHHPEKRTKLNGMQEYTIYHVTSTYPLYDEPDAVDENQSCIPYDPLGGPYPPGAQVTVRRRFTQFEWLYQTLAKHYSALLIPPVPEKQYSGRFASDFIETRRADLEMWMSRLVRHPVLRYSETLRFFLSCDDEAEWRTNAAALLRFGCLAAGKAMQGGVFAHTWHPEFNFDATEAGLEADRLDAFLKAQEKTINGVGGHNAGKHGVLAAYKSHREGNVATSSTYRDLSYTLLRTLTGAGAGPSDDNAPTSTAAALADVDAHRILGPPMGSVGKRSDTGATNEHGAWCWREDCQDCLNFTSALQNTAECMQSVADIYESHARETLLRQHERFKEVSKPHTMAQSLLETHRTTLARYREATRDPWDDDDQDDKHQPSGPSTALSPQEAEKVAARCETVLNVTLSEMDRLHDERVQDYHALGRSLLDGEIELYESVLEQLKAARLHYDEEYYERESDFHILASRYQSDLGKPKKPSAPLLMPSAAQGGVGGLKGGVGMLISQATGGKLEGVGGATMERIGSRDGTVRGVAVDGKGLKDSTNVFHHNSADAALKAIASKHRDDSEQPKHGQQQHQLGRVASRGTSYFSAIWR